MAASQNIQKSAPKPRIRVMPDGELTHKTPYAYYEAAESSRHRNFYQRRGTQNEQVQRSAVAIRTQARHLVQTTTLPKAHCAPWLITLLEPRALALSRNRAGLMVLFIKNTQPI